MTIMDYISLPFSAEVPREQLYCAADKSGLNIDALLITTAGRAGQGHLILCKQKRAW